MTYILYLSIYILSLTLVTAPVAVKRFGIFFVVIFIIVLFGLRVDVGPDYPNYLKIYQGLVNGSGHLYDHVISKTEFGYVYLNIIIIKLGLGYQAVVFFVFATTFILYYLAGARYVQDRALLLIFLLGLGLLVIPINLYRQGLGIALVYWGFRYLLKREYFKYSIIVLLGCTFHYTTLFAFLFIIISLLKQSRVLVWTLFIISIIINRLTHYVDVIGLVLRAINVPDIYSSYFIPTEATEVGFGFRIYIELFYIAFCFFMIYRHKLDKITLFFCYSFLCGLFMNIALANLGIFTRLSMIFYYTGYIAIPLLISNRFHDKWRKVIWVCLLVMSFSFYARDATSPNYFPYCTLNLSQEKICLD